MINYKFNFILTLLLFIFDFTVLGGVFLFATAMYAVLFDSKGE